MYATSYQVPLGIILKNEAKLTEMAEILDNLNQYIPVHESTINRTIEGKSYEFDNSKLIQILLFGDQLTVARSRGAAALRNDDNTPLDRLEGFVPAVADWHARMCLLQVITFCKIFCCYFFVFRLFGNGCISISHQERRALCINSGI